MRVQVEKTDRWYDSWVSRATRLHSHATSLYLSISLRLQPFERVGDGPLFERLGAADHLVRAGLGLRARVRVRVRVRVEAIGLGSGFGLGRGYRVIGLGRVWVRARITG